MSLRTVSAVRYVTPLREGGSLPALVEADDGRQYVVKFRGAGQGPLALVAEVVAGEIARSLGLNVPEIVLVELDPLFGKAERDPEIRDLLRASTGMNVGLAFLPEATTFDAAAGDRVEALLASLIVWFDSFVLNVDRTSRNANLLFCHGNLWLIDHGSALYFHHSWPSAHDKAFARFEQIADHVLLPWASEIEAAASIAYSKLCTSSLRQILSLVPQDWFSPEGSERTAEERRAAYLQFFSERLGSSSIFEKEVLHVRAEAGYDGV